MPKAPAPAALPTRTLTPARRAQLPEAAGKGPALVAPLGAGGLLVRGARNKKAAALDEALAVRATLALQAHGQIAGSPDGLQVAAATLHGAAVLGLDGKPVRKVTHADWWEENSGAVAFVDGGRRLLYACLPDEEENGIDGAGVALGLLDLTRPKAKPALVGLDRTMEAHFRLVPLPDGSAVLWCDAQQDAQDYFHVTLGPDGPVATPLAIDTAPIFLGYVTPDGALLVSDNSALVWLDPRTGAERRRLDLSGMIDPGDDVIAAVPRGADRLLLNVYSFPSNTRALIEIGGAGPCAVEIEGAKAGAVTALATDGQGRAVLVFEDGAVVRLGDG